MKKGNQILLFLIVSVFALQCGSTKSTGEERSEKLTGTYRVSKMIFPDENLMLDTKDVESTFQNVIAQLEESDPDFAVDSARVREQVELDLISIGAFTMNFHANGQFEQSEFFYNNTTAPPFSGFFEVQQKELVITNKAGETTDYYRIEKNEKNTLTLSKTSENNSGTLFIMVLEKAKK